MDSIEANHPTTGSEFFEAQAQLYKHIYSHIHGKVLKCAVELNIPNTIHNHGQPITIPQLISKLEIHPTKTLCVERLLRFLVHNGLLSETRSNDEDDDQEENEASYSLTPSSSLLVKGLEPNLTPMVVAAFHSDMNASLDLLGKWFKGEEKTVTESAFGVEIWDLLERDPQRFKSFNEGMASDSQMIDVALRDCKSIFKGIETLVDVGGGTGTTCRIISERYPDMKCIVFDLPQVVENSSGSNNLSYVGGSMFESIPSADAVLLKWILHNWDDESCRKILTKCKEAVSKKGEGGKVIIIDAVIKEKEEKNEMREVKLLFDIMMLSFFNGKERTEKEWNELLVSAGFNHHKITPLFGFRSIIEAYP